MNAVSRSLSVCLSAQDPLLRGKRCVILADGFYEWKRQDKEKQPYFIYFPQAKRDEEELLVSRPTNDKNKKLQPVEWVKYS